MEQMHKTLPTNEVIAGVIKALETVPRVVLPVRGTSMLPFIIGDVDSVELVKTQSVEVGDVILAWINGSRYVVHRVISIQGNRLTLMGDGNIAGTERCLKDDVKALATHVVNAKGQRHPLDSPWRKRWARLWFALRPVRRYLLYIYRKVKGIK